MAASDMEATEAFEGECGALVQKWIRLQLVGIDTPEGDALMDELDPLYRALLSRDVRQLRQAWVFVLEVLMQTNDDWVLNNLGAGPLEDLVCRGVEDVFSWIEDEAPRNPKLRSVLRDYVWWSGVSEENKTRIRRVM